MTQQGCEEVSWVIPDEKLENFFRKVKKIIDKDTNATLFFDWSRTALSEITPNVERSLKKNFSACDGGYSAAKIAGLYTFWTAKLKPGFSIVQDRLILNEYLAIAIGISIIQERLDIRINLSRDELLDICDTLRYHTSSPHMLMHIYELWIERARRMRHAMPTP